jgi:rhodanese-related sulfurtransferase
VEGETRDRSKSGYFLKWLRNLGKGEVSVSAFRKATTGEDKDAVIVDAHTKEEVAELDIFKKIINIPLDEITARLNELPKNKKYVHCSTGSRAGMAYNELLSSMNLTQNSCF